MMKKKKHQKKKCHKYLRIVFEILKIKTRETVGKCLKIKSYIFISFKIRERINNM